MKPNKLLPLLACGPLLGIQAIHAGQIEADFNDMLLGDTRTRTSAASPNNNNLNSGSGFLADDGSASGGGGEFNNDTGVLQFVTGDLPVPSGVTGFTSVQGSSATGVSMSHLAGANLGSHRMQDRHFASPLTGSTVWFSFLVRLDGPDAEGQVYFNAPVLTGSTSSTNTTGSFGVVFGGVATPGAFAINLTPANRISALVGTPASSLVYYDDLNNNGILDGTETDRNGNTLIDGVEVGKAGIAGISSHLVIGRVTVNSAPAAADTIDLWLDPANTTSVGALGAPTLTATSDEVDAAGIFSVAFAQWRDVAPVPSGGPYTDGGKTAIDHFRASDLANAFDFITGNVQADPKLVTLTSGVPNFNFAGVYGSGTPLSSAPRTVILRNDGATQDIVINSISFQNGNAAGVFNITSQPTLPLTLNPGDTASITMVATGTVFSTAFSDTLVINTDEDAPFPQDLSLPVAATFYTAGALVNTNPGFNTNLNGWQDDVFTSLGGTLPRVVPGFNGTGGMARIRGEGDVGAGAPDNFSQAVLNGASDFEFSFLLSPIATSEFAKYAGGAPLANDRTFQVVIQADSNIPQPANGTEGTWTDEFNNDASLINLAYLPAANDLAVWDSSAAGGAGAWQLLGVGPLTGSVDARPVPVVTTDADTDLLDDAWEQSFFPGDLNQLSGLAAADFESDGVSDLLEFQKGFNPTQADTDFDGIDDVDDHAGNGILNAAAGDTVNWHLIRVKGTNFGSGGASYTVSVSDPNATTTADISAPVSFWAEKSGFDSTPGGYTFTTGDISTGSGLAGGGVVTTSYWLDDVSYFSVQAPDPGVTVADFATIVAHNVPTASGLLTITNTGFNAPLTVTGLTFAPGSAFSTTQVFPLVIPANSSAAVPIDVTATAIPAPNNSVIESVTVVTDAFPVGSVVKTLGAVVTSNSNLLGNWNFETPGTDVVTDNDTFAAWAENNGTVNFGGLVPGSATSARIVAATTLNNTLGAGAGGFQISFPLTMQAPGAGTQDRLFNLQLRSVANVGEEEINLRISNGATSNVQMFNGAWTSFGPAFTAALSSDANADGDFDDAGDAKNVYTMVLTGTGWGAGTPTFGVKLIGTDGTTVLVDQQGLTPTQAFRDKVETLTSPLGLVSFLSTSGTPRFCVDDVSAILVLPSNVEITAISGGPGGLTLNWNSSVPVTVQRSTNLTDWVNISLNDADGAHTDLSAPAGKAFYRVVAP
jgi:hypothetical protein